MSKHTPGPWEWEGESSEYWALNGNNGQHEVIGTLLDGGMEVSEEDARLITAAPDLLEALKYWLPDETKIPEGHGPAWYAAIAAIAKAEGK